MTATPIKRTIAIVGRPNVGKSALFNRLVKRRVAIVHEESGVTRDRLSCEVTWEDERFEILDTGGIGILRADATTDEIERGTRMQVDVALEDAPIVIFVVDITAGILPLDEEVAAILHRSGRTVYLAANKADSPPLDEQTSEFDRLGFPTFPVSALHDRGVGDLIEQAVSHLPKIENETIADPLRVAIVGRPNVGKSSYINRLLRSDRVIVSEVPGTTRDSIEIPFSVGTGPGARHYVLIDTAGIRRQGRVKDAVDQFSMVRTQKAIENCDIAVLVMDTVEGPTTRDKKIAASIIEANKGCLILVNKWDLADEVTQRAYSTAMGEALPFLSFVPVVHASAQSGFNIRKTIETIDYVSSQIQATLSTGVLNRALHDAFQRTSPPAKRGRRMKFYYATQVSKKPVRIRMFVNDPRLASDSYRTYLTNSLRRAFGLEGAPILLRLSARDRETQGKK